MPFGFFRSQGQSGSPRGPTGRTVRDSKRPSVERRRALPRNCSTPAFFWTELTEKLTSVFGPTLVLGVDRSRLYQDCRDAPRAHPCVSSVPHRSTASARQFCRAVTGGVREGAYADRCPAGQYRHAPCSVRPRAPPTAAVPEGVSQKTRCRRSRGTQNDTSQPVYSTTRAPGDKARMRRRLPPRRPYLRDAPVQSSRKEWFRGSEY